MTIHQHTFRAIGCTNSVLTTDATTIDEAARVTEAVVAELDEAASRSRVDSELSRANAAASAEGVDVVVSEVFGGCIAAALHAADITDGLVDPTVGAAVIAAGYDDDLDAVRARNGRSALDAAVERTVPGWRAVAYDAVPAAVAASRHGAGPRRHRQGVRGRPHRGSPGPAAARRLPRQPRR